MFRTKGSDRRSTKNPFQEPTRPETPGLLRRGEPHLRIQPNQDPTPPPYANMGYRYTSPPPNTYPPHQPYHASQEPYPEQREEYVTHAYVRQDVPPPYSPPNDYINYQPQAQNTPHQTDPHYAHAYHQAKTHYNSHPVPVPFHSPRTDAYPSHDPYTRGLAFWDYERDTKPQKTPYGGEETATVSPVRFLLTIFGIVLIFGFLWFSYRFLTQDVGQPAIIEAESGPFRVRPEKPGGTFIPNQDKLIYRALPRGGHPHQKTSPEHLVPSPDQSVVPTYDNEPSPSLARNESSAAYPTPALAPDGMTPYQSMAPHPHSTSSSPAQTPQYSTPPVYEVSSEPHPHSYNPPPTHVQETYIAPYVAPSPPQTTASVAAQQPTHSQSYQQQVTPVSYPHSTTQPTALTPPITETSVQNAFWVQLGTLPTRDRAEQEAKRLTKKWKGAFSKAATIRPTGKAQEHRIVVGPFSNKADAISECLKIGDECRVTQ